MKILIILNNRDREELVMKSIAREIYNVEQSADIEIVDFNIKNIFRFVLKFNPNVILTYPFTVEGEAQKYYLFKILLSVKIICLRAEGVVNLTSDLDIKRHIGYDQYGNNLVDYELFWGKETRDVLGQELLNQNKMNNNNRMLAVGYPRLENSYFRNQDKSIKNLPARISDEISKYSKENILFFVTGFNLADYTRNDFFLAGDADASNNIDELMKGAAYTKRYRECFVKKIINIAHDNPTLLLVIKKHPAERIDSYPEFDGINNILFIHEVIDLNHILNVSGLFLHYGSTTVADSYLSKVPSVYIHYAEGYPWYCDYGFESSVRVELDDLHIVVKNYLTGKITFRLTENMKNKLENIFNLRDNEKYTPSEDIAKLILDLSPAQKIKLTDVFLLKALWNIVYLHSFGRFVNILKKIKVNL